VWFPVLVAIGVAGFLPAESYAGSPRYSDMVLSDAQDGAAKATFAPQTPKLFLRTKLVDVPTGSRVKSEWIAEKTQAAPPNYKIDSVEMKVGPMGNAANFNFSKPTAGWPVGDYRVDLFIDDKLASQVKFKVAK
jgi:hypothetical protein